MLALRALVFVNRHRTVSLGLIFIAEIDSRAQIHNLAWTRAAKSRRLYLIWFFSRTYLCVLLCGFIPSRLPQWHLPHPITENSITLNSPFQKEYLASDSSASFELSRNKAKSRITANEEASFDARDQLGRHLFRRLVMLSLDVNLRAFGIRLFREVRNTISASNRTQYQLQIL